MSFERPSKGVLVFQCDLCFDTYEFARADGADVGDFRSCWATLREEGWTLQTVKHGATSAGSGTEHYCSDCTKTVKADRENPFRR